MLDCLDLLQLLVPSRTGDAGGEMRRHPPGVAARLSDAPRRGAPARFAPEVICQIMALACEDPETLDVPTVIGAKVNWPDNPSPRIESFIAHSNATMAKPFRWTKGKPLVA